MPRKVPQPWFSLIAQSAVGSQAAIEMKMSSDMPLPTPLSVMSSPNHMMRPVPAVMVRTMMRIVTERVVGQDVGRTAAEEGLDGLRANVTSVADWRIGEPDRQVARVLRHLASVPA